MASPLDMLRGALGRLATPTPAASAVPTRDSIANIEARLGLGTDNQASSSAYSYSTVSRSRQNLDNAYRGSWLVGVAVDAVADDMTRGGIEFMGDMDPGDIEVLGAAYARLRLWHQIGHTERWARLYGGAIAVMLIDGQDVSTPLRAETIRKDQFKGLLVLDRWMVQPSLTDLVTDFGPDFGQPVFYTVNVNPQSATGGMAMTPAAGGGGTVVSGQGRDPVAGQRIHYSRVIRLDGHELPFFARQAEMGWGQSVIERLYDRLLAFDSATQGAAQLVYKAHLRTLKVAGLRQVMATGGRSLDGLVASVNMMRRFQSNEGVTLVDGEDEFEVHSYSFDGLPELLSQFAEQCSGALQIPIVRLFGQSPAGFSTGDADLQNYYDMIASRQDAKLRPGVTRLNDVLSRSELGRGLPEGVTFRFRPLWQMTASEKADVAVKVTGAVVQAESSGLIGRKTALEELRQSSATTGVWTNISDEDIESAEEDPPAPVETQPSPNAENPDDDVQPGSASPGQRRDPGGSPSLRGDE